MTLPIVLLGTRGDAAFPAPATALREPNGLLAMGGDLSIPRLLAAYRQGIFPWYGEGQPILWWSPDPRMVFRTDTVHLSRRFRRSLRTGTWMVRMDGAFSDVIRYCAQVQRHGQCGSWITDEMRQAYLALHQQGIAHSVEVFAQDRLVGGLYGLSIGRMFFAESMFSLESGGSKIALAALARHLLEKGFPLMDAQVESPHLQSLGATPWPRNLFLDALAPLVAVDEPCGSWAACFGELPARDLA